jgi:hypothetical protein
MRCSGVVPFALAAAMVAQSPADGLRLYQPIGPVPTQLVDGAGNVVFQWPGTGNLSAHLLADGTLLRAQQTGGLTVPGATGRLQRLRLDGTLLWDLPLDQASFAHHDIEPMPSGNVLVIAWDRMTPPDAIALGRDPALITGSDWLPDSILEIRQTGFSTGEVVWEWHATDHLVQDFDPNLPGFADPAMHPELIDVNYPPIVLSDGDWNHLNGIDYDPIHDLIAISAHSQNEIWIIDHGTTTQVAAGHTGGARGRGGDILWRWGNPEAYGRGTGADQQLFGQHDPRFVPPGYPGAGNLTLFNNQYSATNSAVFELVLPQDQQGDFQLDPLTQTFGPAAPHWVYAAPGFRSNFVSSAQRLPNGNTLICSGLERRVFEVTAAGQVVMSHTDPNANIVFQAHYIEHATWVDRDQLPAATGATIGFDHMLGGGHAGENYLMVGSLSGLSSGVPLPGGLLLPLRVDFLTSAMAGQFNTGPFVQTYGQLDAQGIASSQFVVMPAEIPPGIVGARMDFATVMFDAAFLATRVSNVASVTIVP